MRGLAQIEASPGIHGSSQRRTMRFASDDEMVAARMREACASMRVAEVARLTGAHPESVRRYLAGHAATAGFLVRFCEATGTSADWLLLGRGAQRRADAGREYLAQASAHELCAALAGRIDRPAPMQADPRPRLVSGEEG